MSFYSRAYKLVVGIAAYLCCMSPCMAEKLEEVVKQVVATNPSILVQTARKYEQDNQLRSTIGGYLPKIDFSASYGRDHNVNYFTQITNQPKGEATLTKRELGFNIKQMLFDGFAVRAKVEADSARLQSSSFNVSGKLEEVILKTTAAYIDTIMVRSIFMHAKENLDRHQELMNKLDSGATNSAQNGDLELIKSRLSLAQTRLLDLQRDIRDSQADYIRVVGTKPGTMYRPEAPDSKLPNSEEAAVAVAISNNPEVQIASAEIRAARADKRASKANYFPRFDLEINGTNNNNVDGIKQHTNSLSAMLQMKYNLFRGGEDVALERKSAWAIEEKKQQLKDCTSLIEQNTRHVWSALVSFKSQLVYLKDRIDSIQKTRDAYYDDFINAERSITELLDAENELYTAKADYVTAQYKELLSRFMLLQSMGKLREHFNVQPPVDVAYTPTNWLNGY